ncbi:patatin [Parashewanella curva]|uniref:Patatin n=1 Tax=Parashewanella curva TaxID=2338552 RepID=A0A3L8PYZ7_9GAMM|nr:patatin-like phospholipase family protein [Parashewanella curva]RLV59999.1 patatin [Parashewanella curva]
MKKTLIIGLLLTISLMVQSVSARPKIGLVLSGGGAKGAAHIGVLKVLEENHIPVDYIAGTSIGAYVGGMYALGYSADEIKKIMLSTKWDKGYSDIIPRQDLSFRDKENRDKFNVPLFLGYSDDKLKSPAGILLGQTMSELLRNSTGLVHKFDSFDQLAIPYRAVATDLITSHAVVIDKGSLVFAMQASATVPGALQPLSYGDKLLVDGGISNNMPVDVVKAMGADIVIAVDIGSSLAKKSKLNDAVAVLNQLSTMMTNASTQKQIALLNEKDILIRPKVGSLSTTDFSILPKVYQLGETAAKTQLVKLKRLSMPTSQYASYQAHKAKIKQNIASPLTQPIYKIVLNNDSQTSANIILNAFDIHEGKPVTKQQLQNAIKRVYALNKFEKVITEFSDTPQGRILTLTTKAKSWGPNYFQFGLNWEDDLEIGSYVSVDLAYTLTDITDNGGEWRNELKVGDNKRFLTEFYQPIDGSHNLYFRSRYTFTKKKQGVFDNNKLTLDVSRRTHNVESGIGVTLGYTGFAELGMRALYGRISSNAVLKSSFDIRGYGGYFSLGYDDLDSISFPTEGDRLTIGVEFGRSDVTRQDENFSSDFNLHYQLNWKGAINVGNHIFVGKLDFESANNTKGELVAEPAELGGFLNLSGYHRDALLGNHKAFAALMYQYDLGRGVLGLNSLPLYLGTSVEAGNVWLNRSDVSFSDLIYGGSVFLGTQTQFGPAALGFGYADGGNSTVYFFLGKTF